MNSITKDMCVSIMKDYYRSQTVFLCGVLILLIIALLLGLPYISIGIGVVWLTIPLNVILAICVAILLIAVIAFSAKRASRKIKNLSTWDFYLVEDVVVDFKKRLKPSRGAGSGHNYIYTFKDHGKATIFKSFHPAWEIPSKNKKRVSQSQIEKLSIESCNTGDLFYLLIAQEKGKTVILQCFYKYHFEILPEDFDLIDGRYYCKTI